MDNVPRNQEGLPKLPPRRHFKLVIAPGAGRAAVD